MTREEIEKLPAIIDVLLSESVIADTKEKLHEKLTEVCNLAIKALEQEPRKDEVILTNKEYRELIANEYEHGYCKGYAEALEEQESVIDKIRTQINSNLRGVEIALEVLVENHPLRPKMEGAKDTLEDCLELIDKAESEGE